MCDRARGRTFVQADRRERTRYYLAAVCSGRLTRASSAATHLIICEKSSTMHCLLRPTFGFIAGIFLSTGHAAGVKPESEIIALSDAWIQAEINHDESTLERVLDKNFLATLTSGKTIDKRAYIDWITSEKIDPFVVDKEAIKIHGDAALVIGVIKADDMKVSWVAVRKRGIWRAISLTFSKVSAAK